MAREVLIKKLIFFNTIEGIFVESSCFYGTIEEFKAKVLADNDDRKSKIYLGFADLAEIQFSE